MLEGMTGAYASDIQQAEGYAQRVEITRRYVSALDALNAMTSKDKEASKEIKATIKATLKNANMQLSVYEKDLEQFNIDLEKDKTDMIDKYTKDLAEFEIAFPSDAPEGTTESPEQRSIRIKNRQAGLTKFRTMYGSVLPIVEQVTLDSKIEILSVPTEVPKASFLEIVLGSREKKKKKKKAKT
jgi:hypothetical protein